MKTVIKSAIIISVFLASCSNNNHSSDAYGNFETKEIIISSEATGKIIDLNIEEGQTITKNYIVGIVDTTQLHLKKQQLLAQKSLIYSKLSNVKAQIAIQNELRKNIMLDKKRIEKMFNDGAATQKQFDDINGKLNVIDKQIKNIEIQNITINNEANVLSKQIALVQDQIQRCLIKNPIKGTVLDKYVEPFEMAVAGKSLYKIADIKKMYLRVYVSGSQLSEIKLGQKVKVLIDKGKNDFKKLDGIITWISDEAEFTPKIIQTKEERVDLVYAVKVLVNNNGEIKIGMPGEVVFNY
ncbi:MAG: HlyD family secretion protein [Bacteroidetes bacterium]|nr:MAG: HlyD family secretion protein [Bacteroidota bacterium]